MGMEASSPAGKLSNAFVAWATFNRAHYPDVGPTRRSAAGFRLPRSAPGFRIVSRTTLSPAARTRRLTRLTTTAMGALHPASVTLVIINCCGSAPRTTEAGAI